MRARLHRRPRQPNHGKYFLFHPELACINTVHVFRTIEIESRSLGSCSYQPITPFLIPLSG